MDKHNVNWLDTVAMFVIAFAFGLCLFGHRAHALEIAEMKPVPHTADMDAPAGPSRPITVYRAGQTAPTYRHRSCTSFSRPGEVPTFVCDFD